ncbi:MAG: DNA polymerase III subunit gamma/tau [Oscillospiraceae bacterium]|nr:DNA polymerase III subunit gamma/tau [Oscillospiraceae bacterium]
MYQALYRKYRPRTFDDVVGQEHITQTLKNQVRSDKLSHAYLFIGTRGTGKTTCAKILAKAVNCQNPVDGNPCGQCPTCRGIDEGNIMDVVELDAASNNGVDNVRALRDEAIFSPAGAKKRVYIIDEVHMLSTAAFNALLKIMEEPPTHLMFILATTELKKVPATILSRCQRYTFKRIDSHIVANRLRYVANREGLNMTDSAADLLGRLADGSMRDGLSLMDQVLGDGNITEESVLSATGLAGSIFTAELLKIIVSRDTAGALQLFARLWNDGKDPAMLLNELATLLRDVLLYLTAPDGCDKLISGNFNIDTIRSFSGTLGAASLMKHLDTVQSAQEKLKESRNQRMTVELCLISMCDPALHDDTAGLRARIEELERKLANGVPMAAAAPAPTPMQEAPAPVVEELPPWEEPAPAPKEEPKPAPATRRRPSFEEMMAGTAAKPPVKEDRPPWDEAPPPPVDDYDRPPLPEEPPVFEEPAPAPAPRQRKPAAAAPTAKGPDPNWEPFVEQAKRVLPGYLSALLYQCSAVFTDSGVTLHAPSFPYAQLNLPNNLAKLKQLTNDFYGKPADFQLEAAQAGAPRPAARSLDDFRNDKFNDIVKFK